MKMMGLWDSNYCKYYGKRESNTDNILYYTLDLIENKNFQLIEELYLLAYLTDSKQLVLQLLLQVMANESPTEIP